MKYRATLKSVRLKQTCINFAFVAIIWRNLTCSYNFFDFVNIGYSASHNLQVNPFCVYILLLLQRFGNVVCSNGDHKRHGPRLNYTKHVLVFLGKTLYAAFFPLGVLAKSSKLITFQPGSNIFASKLGNYFGSGLSLTFPTFFCKSEQ